MKISNIATSADIGPGAVTIATPAGGDLSGTLPSPTVGAIGGTPITNVPSGAGQTLVTDSSGAMSWQDLASVWPCPVTLSIEYVAAGQPSRVSRTDATAETVSVITWAGSQVSSVVTTRAGRTRTVTPSYSGSDIVAVAVSCVDAAAPTAAQLAGLWPDATVTPPQGGRYHPDADGWTPGP